MSIAVPSLLLTLIFCLVADSFGGWCAERLKEVPDIGGRLALLVAAMMVLALATISIA